MDDDKTNLGMTFKHNHTPKLKDKNQNTKLEQSTMLVVNDVYSCS